MSAKLIFSVLGSSFVGKQSLDLGHTLAPLISRHMFLGFREELSAPSRPGPATCTDSGVGEDAGCLPGILYGIWYSAWHRHAAYLVFD